MADKKRRDVAPPIGTLNPMTPPPDGNSQSKVRVISFLAAVIVAIVLIVLVKPNELDVYKSFDELEFEDAALLRCVKESAVANGWRDVGDALVLRCNNPSGDGISSLVGIKHLVELTEINLSFNQISDVGPLAELAHLEIVDLSHNRISTVPVFRSAPTLRRIELNYNQIESLDWLTAEHFLALDSLSIVHNHVADISPVPVLGDIRELGIRDNRIKEIAAVSQLHNLVMLDAGKNLVDDISMIGTLQKLRRLFLDRNELVQLEGIETLRNLEELDLAYNPLQSTSVLMGLERLRRLNLDQTGVSRLTGILSLGDLELLRVAGNPDIACADIAAAIQQYGESAVRTDKSCGTGETGESE